MSFAVINFRFRDKDIVVLAQFRSRVNFLDRGFDGL